MAFEADLKSHLAADAGVSALVDDRIWPVLQQEGSDKPAITYQRIAGSPMTDIDGLDGKLQDVRMQIDVWARAFDDARTLAELVRVRLQSAAATFKARVNFDQDFYEDKARLYRVALDCQFMYRLS